MASHLFIPSHQVYNFPNLYILHGKPRLGLLPDLGCTNTASVTGDMSDDVAIHGSSEHVYISVIFEESFLYEEMVAFVWIYDKTTAEGEILNEICVERRMLLNLDDINAVKECHIRLYTEYWCMSHRYTDVSSCNNLAETAVQKWKAYSEMASMELTVGRLD